MRVVPRWAVEGQTPEFPKGHSHKLTSPTGEGGSLYWGRWVWLAGRTFTWFTALTIYRHVVIDEVDRMLDMGFAQSVEDIIEESYRNGCK